MKYHVSLRLIHWIMSIIIIGLLCSGLFMADLPKDDPYKYSFLYPMHKSFGMLIIAFIILRIITRFSTKIPNSPGKMANWEKMLSGLSHFVLYIFMIMIPISGYVMSTAGGHQVSFFGYPLPSLLAKNQEVGALFYNLHIYTAYLLIVLVVMHVLAVFWHYFYHRTNILQRMW